MTSACDIRVRFNNLSNDLVWRILTKVGDDFKEEAASDFKFHGVCYSTREMIPEVGEKHHVGCFGKVVWEGTVAHIYSHDQL